MSASAIACDVAHALGASGETANIVNACAAGTMSIAFACDLIRAGKGKVYLAGGTDAFLLWRIPASTRCTRCRRTPAPR